MGSRAASRSGFVDYGAYIRSAEWERKARAARERAGFRCQVCNDPHQVLHTHHRTYARLGHERPSDLTVLCADCHRLFEKVGKGADCRHKKRWSVWSRLWRRLITH